MSDILFSQISLADLITHIRQVVKEELQTNEKAQLEEKLLSPKEACKLFQPAISRPTLDNICKQGLLMKYNLGGKVLFKYSEIMGALKSYKRYDHNHK
jgi:hypothetical protein